MIVLGIDPGSVHLGWAALGVEGARRKHLASGCIELDATRVDTVRAAIATLRAFVAGARPRLVAVERVERVNARVGFGSTMAMGLCLGHGVGQRLAQAFEDDGLRVAEFTAETWHRHFANARAIDPQTVVAIVANQIAGWPKRSNQHERDAGCVALFASTVLATRTSAG